jgi:hypothetical protein
LNSGPIYQLKEMPEFLKCWIRNGEKDLSQLELYIPLPIAEDILIGFIMTIVGFLFGIGMSFGGIAGILNEFSWGMVVLTVIGFFFLWVFYLGIRMFIRSIQVAALKKNKTVGIWILKPGILIRDVPNQVEYYKWEQLEEAIIENGYVTQTNSPSRHYSVKMLRIDFKVNQIHRLRFKGERGSKIVEPKNELIDLLAYDITSPNVSLKKLIKACEKFIPIKDNKEKV